MAPPSRSQIRINALNRLVKEHRMYVQELEETEAKLKELESTGGDEYEIKTVKQILQETRQVIPRVRQSIDSEIASIREIKGDEEAAAQQAVADAEKYLKVQN